MEEVVLVIHLILALSIVGLVLLQRSEGGGLGIGGGGLGGLATPQGTANILTRATAICAAGFFCTSLLLGILAGRDSTARKSILDALQEQSPAAQEMTVDTDQTEDTTESDTPTETPSAPVAE